MELIWALAPTVRRWGYAGAVAALVAVILHSLFSSAEYIPTIKCVKYNPVLWAGLALGNFITFLCYIRIPQLFLRTGKGLWSRLQSLLPLEVVWSLVIFVVSCGLVHAVLAINVFYAVPWPLFVSVAFMASASTWAAVTIRKHEESVRGFLSDLVSAIRVVT